MTTVACQRFLGETNRTRAGRCDCAHWRVTRPAGRNPGLPISGWFDEAEVLTWQAERSLEDYLGLWTKADSVTLFQDLTVQAPGRPVCLLG